MLTDDEARTLLHQAADTIDVGTTEPLRPLAPRRRWTLPVAAAAAVVLVVALALGLAGGTDPGPAPAPDPLPPTAPVESPTVLDDDPAPEMTLSELQARLTQLSVATDFVDWAQHAAASPPAFSGRVRLLADDVPMRTLEGSAATEKGRWALCSGLPTAACRANALTALDEHDGSFAAEQGPASGCARDLAGLPEDLRSAAADELVRLQVPRAADCTDAVAVELWITADGRIRAVNVLP